MAVNFPGKSNQIARLRLRDDFIATMRELMSQNYDSHFSNSTNSSSYFSPQQQQDHKISVAVALSGGGDSMCLALLLNETAIELGIQIHGLIVDHGLRAESYQEAQMVQDYMMTQLKLPCTILKWLHNEEREAIHSNIMAQARHARYGLLIEHCTHHNIDFLCTAHHRDDQAETILQRLAFGSGIRGLGGIHPRIHIDTARSSLLPPGPLDAEPEQQLQKIQPLSLLRPLLMWGKDDLEQYLQLAGLTWVTDPSNSDERYSRVRARLALPQLSQTLGIHHDVLASRFTKMAENARRAEDFIHDATSKAIAEVVTLGSSFAVLLDGQKFRELHEEIGLRVLEFCLRLVGGGGGINTESGKVVGDKRFRLASLNQTWQTLSGPILLGQTHGHGGKAAAGAFKQMTLGSCLISPWKNGNGSDVLITREINKRTPMPTIDLGEAIADVSHNSSGSCEIRMKIIWDQRVAISLVLTGSEGLADWQSKYTLSITNGSDGWWPQLKRQMTDGTRQRQDVVASAIQTNEERRQQPAIGQLAWRQAWSRDRRAVLSMPWLVLSHREHQQQPQHTGISIHLYPNMDESGGRPQTLSLVGSEEPNLEPGTTVCIPLWLGTSTVQLAPGLHAKITATYAYAQHDFSFSHSFLQPTVAPCI